MGQTTPNIGIYLPAPGEENYSQSFDSGMINIDQHDHSGGPNKGLPIGPQGLADFAVHYYHLNADVVDQSTGIGVSAILPNQLQILGLLKNIFQLATTSGFISKDGSLAHARTFTAGAGVTITNGDGVAGNPVISLTGGGVQSIAGTVDQIAVTVLAGAYTIALTPIVINPTQPAFLASIVTSQDNVTGDGTDYKVLFPNEVFDQGNNYSIVTSEFTAPKTGVYDLGVNLDIGDATPNLNTEVAFYINGVSVYTVCYLSTANIVATANVVLTGRQVSKLTANDVVSVHLIVNSGGGKITDIDGGNFTAVLLF